MTRPNDSQQKNLTCRIVNFVVPADHRIANKKKIENNNNYSTGWVMWFIAMNWNLNIWPNGICTTNICPGEWDIQTPLEFDIKTDHLISARRPDLTIINKNREFANDGDSNWNCCTGHNPQRTDKDSWRLHNKKVSRDHPEYCIIKIGQYTEKRSGDLKELDFTQTLAKKIV